MSHLHDSSTFAQNDPVWTEPVVTFAPSAEPVTLALTKEHVRVLDTDHDTILDSYIEAARDYVEKRTGLSIVAQEKLFSRRDFADTMYLPVAPVQSVIINYLDLDNVSQLLAASVYVLGGVDTLRPVIRLAEGEDWPDVFDNAEAVSVCAVTGFGETPAALTQAMLLLIGHWFANRETITVGSTTAMLEETTAALLENYRMF